MSDTTRDAVLKLEAAAAVRPDLAPVVSVAVAVVKSAQADVAAATARAEAAEARADKVQVERVAIEKRAHMAEAAVLVAKDQMDAAEEIAQQERRRAARRKARRQAEEDAEDAETAAFVKRIEAGDFNRKIEMFCALGMLTREIRTGESALFDRRKNARFNVYAPDGDLIAEAVERSEAVEIVKSLAGQT
jgi:hypothetical protein